MENNPKQRTASIIRPVIGQELTEIRPTFGRIMANILQW